MLFYDEIRRKIKNQSKSNLNNNIIQNNKQKKSLPFNNYKAEKESNSKLNIIDNKSKSNSFFMTKKKKELQDITNLKKDNKIITKKNPNKKKNKQFLYTFQNFYNNYPIPEPLPKKIDIRIINDNNNNSNITNLNESKRNEKSLYDDKTILFILTNLGLEDLFLKFKENRITYNDLQFLTKEDFIEMKIPIGPRNRIIHFIQEMQRNKAPLDFESLRNFIDKYKKKISNQNQNINFGKNNISNDKIKIENKNDNFIYDKKSQNSLIFSSQFDLDKNDNLSPLDKNINSFLSFNNYYNNNIYSNKSNNNNLEDFSNFNQDKDKNKNKNKMDNEVNPQKYLSEKHLENVYSSYSLNNGKKKNEENILNHISYNKNSRNKNSDNLLLEQKDKDKEIINYNNKRSYSQNIIKNNTKKYNPHNKSNDLKFKNYTYNYEYIKVRHLKKNYSNYNYNEYIPTKKKIKPNLKEKNKNRNRNKNNVLKRNYTYTNIKNNEKVKNPYESFYSNNSNFSRNLLNKLDLITKEVEKYESNYERLKNETKIRNKNVNLILSNNNIIIKKNNNHHQKSRNVIYVHNKDLENEKERSLKNELNSRNFRI